MTSAAAIKDKFTGDSRGFGFVEMAGKQEALTAMESLDGKELQGKALKVLEARPRDDGRRDGGQRSWQPLPGRRNPGAARSGGAPAPPAGAVRLSPAR